MHVDGPAAPAGRPTPDRVEQRVTGHRGAAVGHQHPQDLGLLRPQHDGARRPRQDPSRQPQSSAVAEPRGRLGGVDGAERAQLQLLRRPRVAQVVGAAGKEQPRQRGLRPVGDQGPSRLDRSGKQAFGDVGRHDGGRVARVARRRRFVDDSERESRDPAGIGVHASAQRTGRGQQADARQLPVDRGRADRGSVRNLACPGPGPNSPRSCPRSAPSSASGLRAADPPRCRRPRAV